MTHFSDFSYLARGIADLFVLIWSIIHIYDIDKFEALKWKVIKRREVKSIMTILFLLSVISLLIYDAICTKIKYTEGFIIDPVTKGIIGKPEIMWSQKNKELRTIANRLLMFFYATENSAVFLLQNFWNYLANKIVKTDFISTWQFRINYVFVFIAFVLFNCLPTIFNDDDDDKLDLSNIAEVKNEYRKHAISEVAPELAAACCNLVVLVYGLMAHFKFSSLIKQNSKNYIVDRLKYYRHMNFLLILIVAIGAGLILTLSIDGLTDAQVLNKNKFSRDLLVGIVNFFMAAFWIIWLMIFYPRLIPAHPSYINKQLNEEGSGKYTKLSTPVASPTSESPNLNNNKDNSSLKKSSITKYIEIKVDSTTTTTNTNQLNFKNDNYINEYNNYYNINGNDGYINNVQNDNVQLPLPLAINNKQVISYTGSPKQYQYFTR